MDVRRTAIDSLNGFYYIVQTSERCQSGRMGRSRNPESVTGPRVRIPLSPLKQKEPPCGALFVSKARDRTLAEGSTKPARAKRTQRVLRLRPPAATRRARRETK